MTTATKIPVITVFQVEFLGVESVSSFTGYGVGPGARFSHSAYGVGDTEEEALEDCLEMVSQQVDIDEETEKRIRAAYGSGSSMTVAEYLGLSEDDEDDGGDECLFHVGLKWSVQ
jgi:hypothetical protein